MDRVRAKLEPRNTKRPSRENVFIPLYTNMSSPAHQNFMYIKQKCTTTLQLLLLQLPSRLIDINASLILPYLSIPTT